MKKKSFLLSIILFIFGFSCAQDYELARGATPGELYLTSSWYGIYDTNWGPPIYNTLKTAIYRLIEHGKNLTIQYNADYFADSYTEPGSVMQPYYILADVTPGVVYSYRNYYKNSYEHCQLWVSFDYGKNWIFREEDMGRKAYVAANVEKLTYRGGGDGLFKSNYFGLTYEKIPIPTTKYGVIGRTGLDSCEFWNILGSNAYSYQLVHTTDCRETHTFLPIDSQYMFGQICGISSSVYRGGLPGEVYISSWFPGVGDMPSYKVSFSADTGHTFRHVYVAKQYCDDEGSPVFMSDREPGVFYIVRKYEIEDKNPWGWHTKICVEYYRNYGETLVDTYCHDITKDYDNNVGIKPITNDELRITVYPNPAFSTVTIEANNFSKVEIYNIFGQLLQTAKTQVVDVSTFNAGVYFFKVFDVEGNSVVKRVVVVR